MTRVAAVDCGTNTVKLLVADVDPKAGTQDNLVRELRIVRLGQDVDRTGRLADEALARLFTAVEEYAAIVATHDVDALRFVATSAVRDAGNVDEFTRGVRERLGVEPEVVSGDEEAALSYDGATRALVDVPFPVAVLDIGGGSTELILGDAPARVSAARSLDIGSVRLTERLLPSDPPTAAEVAAATRVVDGALDTLPSYGVHAGDARTLVGTAGTVTTVAAVLLGLDHYDRARVHHASFSTAQVHELTARLLAATVAERELLHVPPGRSDVIGAGALILDRVLRRSGADRLLVSDSDILDGIAWSIA
ncbi:Ppx/GppA phosphatase family protein [Nocardioides panacis]|uniref:Ppx/GppA phosphatase family protein n=1 Tax=Nocardioides panacis TaxID=2849501 RepID=UPI0020B2A30D|nr:Ppx/GppA phosphatase family protein [Nocardioides panacis]